jgi:hypothetical protein
VILHIRNMPEGISPPVRDPFEPPHPDPVNPNDIATGPVVPSQPEVPVLNTVRPDTAPAPIQVSMVLNDPYYQFRRYIGPLDSLPVLTGTKRIEMRTKKAGRTRSRNGKKSKQKLDFIPSHIELEALNLIWEFGEITDMEIYAQIDTSLKITAKDLNSALEKLEEKGLLSRWIVSPQNKFGFNILPEDFGIEMSAKNRRNRVYRYRSHIDRETVLRYLTAALEQCRLAAEQGPDTLGALQTDLFEKARRITKIRTVSE